MDSSGEFLEDYCKDSYTETQPPQAKRAKIVSKNYKLSKTFDKVNDAKEAVAAEKIWSINTTNRGTLGTQVIYRCNKVTSRSKIQCESGLMLLYHADSTNISLFRSSNDHTCHSSTSKAKLPMDDEMKIFVKSLFEQGLKPNQIAIEIGRQNRKAPTKNQLRNYISSLKKIKYGSTFISLGQLETLLLPHIHHPEEDNKAFVVKKFSTDIPNASFRVVISSKKLLKNALKSNVACIDSTYKVNYQGFPFMVLGTVDRAKQFHPIAAAICSHETAEDFEFIFLSIKEIVFTMFGVVLDFTLLMADAAEAISNGFLRVFTGKVLMCAVHVKRAIKKRVISKDHGVAKENRDSIIRDVQLLQLCTTNTSFDKATTLFTDYWTDKEPEFVEYFRSEWLEQHPNWHEGASSSDGPSSNNGLESFNLRIKEDHTIRERLPLSQFIDLVLEAVEAWGRQYDSEYKIFKTEPEISSKIFLLFS